MKKCIKCNISKELIHFHKGQSRCKSCRKEDSRKYYLENHQKKIEYQANYTKINKEKIKSYKKQYYKDCIKYPEFAINRKKYENNKLKTDIQFKLKKNLRNRLFYALRDDYKSGSAISDLGCSIEDFKPYLESKFYNNPRTGECMSWENYGYYGWHIDHIIPLSSFDLTDREQLLKACHYTNLQPLWAEENISKGSKL